MGGGVGRPCRCFAFFGGGGAAGPGPCGAVSISGKVRCFIAVHTSPDGVRTWSSFARRAVQGAAHVVFGVVLVAAVLAD